MMDTHTDKNTATLEIDYPDQPRSRVSVLFRIILIIPILLLAASMIGHAISGTALLIMPALLMIVFRKKYPKWWFEWNNELMRFNTRISAYMLLLTDTYPSADEHQSVHLQLPDPNEQSLNRWLPLVKWFLAIPHYIVFFILICLAIIVTVLMWVWLILTAHYPRSLFNFVVGVLRYQTRVIAYAFLMTTDKYPPFSLK